MNIFLARKVDEKYLNTLRSNAVRAWDDWSSAILSVTYARNLAESSTVASASFSS